MPTISWNEGSPSDTDSAGLGDDQFRSLKSSIRVGLDGEHVWPSGGGDAGVHRLGSARAYYGTESLVSSVGTDGRIMQTSDTSRLFHVGSAGTSLIGGATALLVGEYPDTPPQRHYWAIESGEGRTNSGSTTVNYPSAFSGVARVVIIPRITTLVADGGASIMWVSSPGANSFVANSRKTDGATNSSQSFYWHSIGTRCL